jgi:hypothetical protein
MALTSCKNCGHSISDKAEKCPKCGHYVQTPAGVSTGRAAAPRNTIETLLLAALALGVWALVVVEFTKPSQRFLPIGDSGMLDTQTGNQYRRTGSQDARYWEKWTAFTEKD